MQVTVGDLATRLGVDYAVASAIVKLMVSGGAGREAGKRPTATGKGKPAVIYDLSDSYTLDLTQPLAKAA